MDCWMDARLALGWLAGWSTDNLLAGSLIDCWLDGRQVDWLVLL